MKVLTNPQYSSGFLYLKPGGESAPIAHCAETFFIPGHRVLPHAHEGFEFVYLSRGSATRRAGGPLIRQRMGDLYMTYPREVHAVECRKSEEGRQIHISLHLDRLGAHGTRLARLLARGKVRLLHDCQAVEPILQAIIEQAATNRMHRHEVIAAYLYALCAVVEQAAAHAGQPDRKTKVAVPYSRAVQKALFYMQTHLERRLPLSELAQAAAISNPCQFCTLFRREVGRTPAAHHLQLRLDVARRALLQPGANITTVAMHHGFSSSQHFSIAFRRVFGVSPGNWKNAGKRKSRGVEATA